MRFTRVLLVPWLLAASGCLSDDRCDPGYVEDHGGCNLPSRMPDGGLLDAAAKSDGGGGNPAATFGTRCTSNAECGGNAPSCAAPNLPYCTVLNCTGRPGTCPSGWQCLDISQISTAEGVDSLCLRL